MVGADDYEVSDDLAWEIRIPTDDASIARRRRALAPIQRLTEIERNKANLEGEFWDHFDLFSVALAVIDQVALAMGISAGTSWEETLAYAAEQAKRQCPDAHTEEWSAVAERVLVSLVTTEVEVVPYLVHSGAGPEWRAQRFRLLYVYASGPDGTEHLRASEQAINIFVDALDLDVEAAQIANEAQLAALIRRGAVDAAVQVAVQARYRSIQLQERVRRIVADTLINPEAHDWIDDVPALLDAALAHVRDRLDSEANLLDAVMDRRVDVADSSSLQAANRLVELLRECRHRHDELHQHLIGARSRLRSALDDRFSRPPQSVRRFDLAQDLLEPLLGRRTDEAASAARRLVAATGGFHARWWPTLAVLTDELCAPLRSTDPGEEFVDAVFNDDEVAAWWEPYEDTVDALFVTIDEPIRLSKLLTRVAELSVLDQAGDSLEPGLLTAAIVHAAHRAWATRLAGRTAGDRLVLAIDSGERIERVDLECADLLLVPGAVTDDIDEGRRRPRPNGRLDFGYGWDDEEAVG